MNKLIGMLTTEQQNDNTRNIHQKTTEQIVTLINNEDQKVADTISGILPQIAEAIDLIVQSFHKQGRLFFVGAGTSGRLGILDASECPPTYGTDPQFVQGIIAGGKQAIQEAVEGAEDSEELGSQDMDTYGVRKGDVVVGIAASGRTPYVLGAMKRAREIGSTIIGITNNHDTPMCALAHVMLEAIVGPEVILGSTRMKAGTAQKMILNMLTTASMIRLGKVYDNLMVDLNPSNEKLIYRAKRIIQMATDANSATVEKAYTEANGHVKTAIVMILTSANYEHAVRLLDQTGGFVQDAIKLNNSSQT